MLAESLSYDFKKLLISIKVLSLSLQERLEWPLVITSECCQKMSIIIAKHRNLGKQFWNVRWNQQNNDKPCRISVSIPSHHNRCRSILVSISASNVLPLRNIQLKYEILWDLQHTLSANMQLDGWRGGWDNERVGRIWRNRTRRTPKSRWFLSENLKSTLWLAVIAYHIGQLTAAINWLRTK